MRAGEGATVGADNGASGGRGDADGNTIGVVVGAIGLATADVSVKVVVTGVGVGVRFGLGIFGDGVCTGGISGAGVVEVSVGRDAASPIIFVQYHALRRCSTVCRPSKGRARSVDRCSRFIPGRASEVQSRRADRIGEEHLRAVPGRLRVERTGVPPTLDSQSCRAPVCRDLPGAASLQR